MRRLSPRAIRSRQGAGKAPARGITLIESLVAIVVVALGILGILGVQLRNLTDTQTTVRRAQAVRLIEDLSERMKVNPNALKHLANYVSGFDDLPTPGSCATACSAAEQASYDLAVWKQTVASSLPLGKASVFVPPAESALSTGQGRQLGVMIAWRENERVAKVSADDDKDATSYRGAINASLGAGDLMCPDGHTCHLQYLSVSARCAPYDDGSGTWAFHCP